MLLSSTSLKAKNVLCAKTSRFHRKFNANIRCNCLKNNMTSSKMIALSCMGVGSGGQGGRGPPGFSNMVEI